MGTGSPQTAIGFNNHGGEGEALLAAEAGCVQMAALEILIYCDSRRGIQGRSMDGALTDPEVTAKSIARGKP